MKNRTTRQLGTRSRSYAVAILSAVSALAITFSPAMQQALAQQEQATNVQEISATAMNQIDSLVREKLSRTATQRKIDSQLLMSIRVSKGQYAAEGIRQLQTNVQVAADGTAVVDIKANVTSELLETIKGVGGEIISSVPRFNSVRARVPLGQMEYLAGLPAVQFIGRPARAKFYGSQGPSRDPFYDLKSYLNPYHSPAFELRAHVRRELPDLLSHLGARPPWTASFLSPPVGSVTTEGDKTHQADQARAQFGVDGTGVKIGVLSDSVDSLATSQAAGELGAVTVLPGQSGVNTCGDFPCSGEGTAMLEIIHDIVPGAQLYFATASISEANFAQNILDLRAAGCDIIVDDVAYLDESPFQDGIAAQAVNAVTADGALYFSSAGNSGNLTGGTSSVWEGDFADGGQITVGGQQVTVHSFGAGIYNSLINGGGGNATGLLLFWSDPLGLSANDYDLYILDTTGTVVQSRSDNFQTGSQDPFEFTGPLSQGQKIVIVKTQGAARFLHLGAVAFNATTPILSAATSGQQFGHATASNCISVAAVPAASPFPSPVGMGPNPTGPFPNPFTAANHIERFSSDGSRRVFYNADGTTITAGNVSSTGGVLRQKPDIAAADGVSTSFPSNSGLNPFFGTSAAAPHAAAIAALLKSLAPTMTSAEIRSVLKTTAIDIESPGVDRDSGSGIVMALPALQSIATGVNLSTTAGAQTVTQGQNAVYSIAINRRNFAGTVNLSITGLPTGASASFNPASTTGNTSTLTITTNSGTATGSFAPSVNGTASGITIFPLTLGLTVNPSCSYSVSPAARNFDSSAAGASITVSAAGGCVWTATPTESWITINSGSPGNGGGTVNYSVGANSGGARSGRILIANQTFVITQSGNNPAAGNWIPASGMKTRRGGYSITALQNGKVLVAGGYDGSTLLTIASAELFDPSTGTWSYTGSLTTPRAYHRAALLQNGKVLILGGSIGSGATSTAELYDPVTGIWTSTGSMTMLRSGFSATPLPNGKLLISGGQSGNTVLLSAELYDPLAGNFTLTGDMKFATSDHVAVLMQNGKVLAMGGYNSNFIVITSAQIYDPASGTWSTTNGMGFNRAYHSAVLLPNGKILVAGGSNTNEVVRRTVELYDPASGLWSQVSQMNEAREFFTMTLLLNGNVLVTGGNSNDSNFSSAEIYNPATNRWTRTASMVVARVGHSAVLLPSGKVLVASGDSNRNPFEIFDPGFVGNWSLTGSMVGARWDHTATLLNNSDVLVAGGNGPNGLLNSVELYDYTTGLWRITGSLAVARRNHSATLLSNGKVLVAGGNNGLLTFASAELYNPATGVWTMISSMQAARSSHAATLLQDGRIFITGGNGANGPLNTAEIYDPASNTWTSAPNMAQPRAFHTGTLLPTGLVLVVGGTTSSGPPAELFNPASGLWSSISSFSYYRYGHTATLLLNANVLVAGGLGVRSYDYASSGSELFTGVGQIFSNSLGMQAVHFFHVASLLQNGNVLVAGGDEGGAPGAAASEIYDRQSNAWSKTTDLIAGREFHTATLLPNGKVLVTGGVGGAGALSSAELYDVSPGCSFALNQASQNFPSAGGSGGITVTSGNACLWSAVSNASFITITSGTNGVSNGVVNFSVAASNAGSPRTGTITIGDKLFTVTQAAGVVCTYSISPTSNQVSGFGGTRSFNITTPATDCAWTASSNATWITITPPSISAGSAAIGYSVAPNGGPARSGTISVGGQTHTVNQEAGCSIMPIIPGTVINGTLSTTDCHTHLGLFGFAYADRYSFGGTAGQQILISQKAAYPPFLSLLKPDATIAAQGYQNDGFNARIPSSGLFTLPVSGIYVIDASSVFNGSTGPYTLTLTVLPPPVANDDFINARVINGPSGTVYGNNVAASKEAGEPNHAGNVGGKSVWYRWQAPSDGSVRFNTFGSSFDTLLAVYKGSSVSALTQIATNDNDPGSGVSSQVTFGATAGTVYQIAIDGNSGAAGKVTLNWTPPPANNDFANAQAITGSVGIATGSSVLATKEPGEPNHAGDPGRKSIWYRWQAPGDGNVTFTTSGSSFDTVLGVYTGSSVNSLTLIGSNDDASRDELTSKVVFSAVSGTVYQIAVDGFSGDSGNVILSWSIPSTNNDFASAQAITGGSGSVRANNQLATKESGEPNHAGNSGGKSLWFRWQAPANGNVTFTTNGSNFNTLLGVYTGSSVGSLTLIGSNDDNPGGGGTGNGESKVVFSAVSGTVYQIAVDGYFGAFGNSNLGWGPTPANDNFANAQVITGSSGSAAGSNVLASKESGETNHAGNSGGNSIWYRWQAPANGNVTFSTNGSSFDTLLAVYTGSSVNSLTLVGNNDDDPGDVRTSRATFSVVSGTVYQIAVDGYSGASDNTNLNWSLGAPTPTWEPVVLTASQAEIKTWTTGGRTYAYLKLLFPNAGYRVTNWGQATRAGNDFTADAAVEKFTGASIQSVTTTAQIYDLGPLVNGTYNFNFKTSGTLAKTLQFIISSTVPPANPIDDARFFVKQQYLDFLNRTADQAGEDFWTDNITKCNDPARRPPGQTVQQCTLRQRETTSGAFFLSPEFQYTGYFVYRMYQGVLGRQPKLSEFTPDALTVGNGIIVNGQLSGAQINQNKAAFAAQFVNCVDATKYRCAEFKAIYDGLSSQQYVDKLFLNTGVNASAADRTALVNELNANPTTGRATVLQKVVDGINVISEGNQQFTTTYGQTFYNSELNRAFVQFEYFGYLRRDPDDAGYAFWLAKLNQFGGDFVAAEMVLAFISSPEYRARFGQP